MAPLVRIGKLREKPNESFQDFGWTKRPQLSLTRAEAADISVHALAPSSMHFDRAAISKKGVVNFYCLLCTSSATVFSAPFAGSAKLWVWCCSQRPQHRSETASPPSFVAAVRRAPLAVKGPLLGLHSVSKHVLCIPRPTWSSIRGPAYCSEPFLSKVSRPLVRGGGLVLLPAKEQRTQTYITVVSTVDGDGNNEGATSFSG